MHERDDPNWYIPDVRDGLTRLERIVLYVLANAQRELNGRSVPTAMLYGRVLEYVDLGEAELQACLQGLIAREARPRDDASPAPRVRVNGQFARIDPP
jgi:uncharacterized protein YehS (DUF1456 family)